MSTAIDSFLKRNRQRWQEALTQQPDETLPNMPIQQVNTSWIGKRSRDQFTIEDALEYEEQFFNYRHPKRKAQRKPLKQRNHETT